MKSSKVITVLGLLATMMYLVALRWLVDSRWGTLRTLPLNEIGDFLAGAFGPLAILWLVLGYLQQGIELRQNSEALHLQAQELGNAVEQQRELVKVARDQYEADREALDHQRKAMAADVARLEQAAKPRFTTTSGASHNGVVSKHQLHVRNYGASCTDVRIASANGRYIFAPALVDLLSHDGTQKFFVTIPHSEEAPEGGLATLSYVDSIGRQGSETYLMDFERAEGYWNLTMRAI